MTSYICFNGSFLDIRTPCIPNKDSGLTLGLGVFDTALCIGSDILYAKDHYERLSYDCNTVLNCKIPFSYDVFEDSIKELILKNKLQSGQTRVRTQITSGTAEKPFDVPDHCNVLISCAPAETEEKRSPIHAWIVSDFPKIAGCILENCKRLDYSRNNCAMRASRKKNGNEAILTNTEGRISCATTSNIFIIEGNSIFTPPLREGVLNGVTRKKILEHFQVQEGEITQERLLHSEGVFLANSMYRTRAVSSINNSPLPSPQNSLYTNITEYFFLPSA